MWAEQKRRIWTFLFTLLQFMSWVTATSRIFSQDAQGKTQHSLQVGWDSKQEFYDKKMEGMGDKGGLKELSTVGSRPPICMQKCGECNPCEAIQVPTTTDHLGVQYANYEPEGWKCKCGTSFFNP